MCALNVINIDNHAKPMWGLNSESSNAGRTLEIVLRLKRETVTMLDRDELGELAQRFLLILFHKK